MIFNGSNTYTNNGNIHESYSINNDTTATTTTTNNNNNDIY